MTIPTPASIRSQVKKVEAPSAPKPVAVPAKKPARPVDISTKKPLPNKQKEEAARKAYRDKKRVKTTHAHVIYATILTYKTLAECKCGEKFETIDAGKTHLQDILDAAAKKRAESEKNSPKKDEHLSDRPLEGSEELKALRETLPQNYEQNHAK